MKQQRSKKSAVVKTLWNQESATILSSMEFLTRNFCKQDSDAEEVGDDDLRAIKYLMDRLELNSMQVQLLTCVFYHQAAHPNCICDFEDLSDMLKVHPLRSMQYKDELEVLEEKGYLVGLETPRGDSGWRVTREAISCLNSDQAFSIDMVKLASSLDFLIRANQYIGEGMRFDQNNAIRPRIRRLMRQNTHLPVVRNLMLLSDENYDMWFMLVMMTTLAVENDPTVSISDFERVLTPPSLRTILRGLQQGTHMFAKEEYVELVNQGGMVRPNQWILTNKAWIDFIENKDELEQYLNEEEQSSELLTSYRSLHEKQLFFSGKTQEQIERLSNLLKEEKFANVRSALASRGMPTGFCCLFYGSPGTGKTELVQQLAIATERDLMQVDMSTLRDKYVGESEKHIKHIFSTYRGLVQKQKKAPILFFNEADAIFGNRMENTQHSVDKMENAIQNIILQEMEQFEGIMICTTNLTTCMDKAFDRRFLYKIEFERPTNEARKQIWKSLLTSLNDDQASELANKFDFSGGQIQNITRKQIVHSIFSGNEDLDYEQVKLDCQNEQISRQNGRKIGF